MSRWWPVPAAYAVALLLFLAAYSNSLRNAFHFDDSHLIVENLHIRDIRNIPRFFTNARTFSSLETNAVYRPVVSTTLALDHFIGGGLNPVPFHITQLILLAAVGAGLFLLLLSLFRTTDADARWPFWAALFAATLFSVHTGNTETANYISARSELLSSLGVLGAFLLYLYVPGTRRFHLYLLPVVFGALAKPSAVLFAPLFLAYKLLFEEQLSLKDVVSRSARPRVRRALFTSAPAFILGIVLYLFVAAMSAPGQTYGGGSRLTYFITQTWIWLRYVRLFFIPTGLTADTDLGLFSTWNDVRILAGLALLGVSLAALWRASEQPVLRPTAFGIAWFWIALIPTSSIFPLAEVTNDHRVFFPFIGLAMALVGWIFARGRAWASHSAERRAVLPRVAWTLASLLLVAHAGGTFLRNRVWRTDETLWADVLKKSPRNGRGLMNYGLSQMRAGRLQAAQSLFLRAQQLTPNYPFLEINLGAVSGALGDTTAAEQHFLRAVSLDPRLAPAHREYGRWLIDQGRSPEAIQQLEQSIALASGDVDSRRMLMSLAAARGDSERLRTLATETLRIAQTDSIARAYADGRIPFAPAGSDGHAWLTLGFALTGQNRHADAAQVYRAVLASDSTDADAWNNLGWSLAKLGFYDDGVRAFDAALRHRPGYDLARNNRKWAEGEVSRARFMHALARQRAGDYGEAILRYRELLAQYPGWAAAHFNLGFALMSLGSCTEAAAEFERTLALQPSFSAAHLHLATCYGRLGRQADASRHRAAYERATGTNKTTPGP